MNILIEQRPDVNDDVYDYEYHLTLSWLLEKSAGTGHPADL